MAKKAPKKAPKKARVADVAGAVHDLKQWIATGRVPLDPPTRALLAKLRAPDTEAELRELLGA